MAIYRIVLLLFLHFMVYDVVAQFLGGTDFNPCPSGFEKHAASCYRYINISYSWIEAVTACTMMRSNLVEINNADENRFLTSFVLNATADWRTDSLGARIWTGGSNMQGQLLWMASQTPVEKYTSWRAGEPYTVSDSELYCILKMGDDWFSDKCTHDRQFVCEKELDGLVIPEVTEPPVDKEPIGRK